MKLLVTTQTVDRDNPVLGFFHEWLALLAPQFTSIEVICLAEGMHTLPQNVRVHTLGKESGRKSKFTYATRFLKLIRQLHVSYDCVFVHMNTEYVLLGALYWKLLGKRVYLWYNHPKGGVRLDLATRLADKVFYTSPFAASAGLRKSVRMPAGIDTELFSPQRVERKTCSLYLQGRVMPSKRVNLACETVLLLRERGVHATLDIVGPEDAAYAAELKKRYDLLIQEGAIVFHGGIPNRETPVRYSAHAVALNLAASGHYDKSALEAMACETPLIAAGHAFSDHVASKWTGKDTPLLLADALEQLFALPEEERMRLGQEERASVVAKESLAALVSRLSRELSAGYPSVQP